MTSTWVLLLSTDTLITATSRQLCREAGLRLVVDDITADAGPSEINGDPPSAVGNLPPVVRTGAPPEPPGPGSPALVLIGSDRPPERPLPAMALQAPRILVASALAETAWRTALDLRVEQVVVLPDGETALRSRLGRLAEHGAEGLVLAVTAGCGGGGASVLATTLARTANAVTPTVLVDLDPLGGGLDLLLGAQDEPGARWPDLASARGRLLPGSLAGVLPVIDGVRVLSWDREPQSPGRLPVEAVEAVIGSARAEYGVVVLDLPRALDPGARAAAQLADITLVTMPAQVRATAAAGRVLAALNDLCADIRLVVRESGASGPQPAMIAAALKIPLAEILRPEPGLRDCLNRGIPPGMRRRGPLATFSREFLALELANLRWQRERAS